MRRILTDFPWLWAIKDSWVASLHRVKVVRDPAKIETALCHCLQEKYLLWLHYISHSFIGPVGCPAFVEGAVTGLVEIRPEETIACAIKRNRKEYQEDCSRVIAMAIVHEHEITIYISKNWKDAIESVCPFS
ncbi:MAG: hypothetical protein PHE24_00370 [Patescibacteria group bacterium]|nr:hypothetical protein [Patescibacteria group bacterium]